MLKFLAYPHVYPSFPAPALHPGSSHSAGFPLLLWAVKQMLHLWIYLDLSVQTKRRYSYFTEAGGRAGWSHISASSQGGASKRKARFQALLLQTSLIRYQHVKPLKSFTLRYRGLLEALDRNK